jgi:hypothetical protein
MLGVWDALVLVDESYEAHYVSFMHNFYTPLLWMHFGYSTGKTNEFQ